MSLALINEELLNFNHLKDILFEVPLSRLGTKPLWYFVFKTRSNTDAIYNKSVKKQK